MKLSHADDVAIQVRSAELLYKVSCRQRGCGPIPELQKQLQQSAEESKHLVKVVLKGPSVDDASLQSVLDLLAGYNPVRALHCWGTSISDQVSSAAHARHCHPLHTAVCSMWCPLCITTPQLLDHPWYRSSTAAQQRTMPAHHCSSMTCKPPPPHCCRAWRPWPTT